MAVVRKHLSGSSNGKAINVALAATPGTVIHTDPNVADQFDEVELYAFNYTGSDPENLTIEIGSSTGAADRFVMPVPLDDGLHLVLPQHSISGGEVIRAFTAGGGSRVSIIGQVNRIS